MANKRIFYATQKIEFGKPNRNGDVFYYQNFTVCETPPMHIESDFDYATSLKNGNTRCWYFSTRERYEEYFKSGLDKVDPIPFYITSVNNLIRDYNCHDLERLVKRTKGISCLLLSDDACFPANYMEILSKYAIAEFRIKDGKVNLEARKEAIVCKCDLWKGCTCGQLPHTNQVFKLRRTSP